jgi:8-oxo-dGTP diphosphatase
MVGPIAVVGVALVREGSHGRELLAARRTEPPELAGGWEIPGGKVDPGETEEQAAHREIDEELGVAIELGERVDGPVDGRWPLGPAHLMAVYLGRIVDDAEPVALVQHDELRWLPLDRWDEVAWLEGDLGPVRAVVERLRSGA